MNFRRRRRHQRVEERKTITNVIVDLWVVTLGSLLGNILHLQGRWTERDALAGSTYVAKYRASVHRRNTPLNHFRENIRSWVRIPPRAWIFVCCECRVLSGRGLCDELITRPEESYRLCCVVVCDLETSRIGAPYVYI